jgi:hypothetical protein
MIKDENGDLFANSHDILNIYKNYSCLHTAGSPVPEPSPFEDDTASENDETV